MKNLNWKTILPYLVIVLLGVSLFFLQNKVSKLNQKVVEEVKLRTALLDTVTIYRNSRNELVAEKLSLQSDLNNLTKIKDQLTSDQRELLKRIKEVEKDRDVINAALIKTRFELDSIRKGQIITDIENKTVTILDSLPDIEYNFTVGRVLPAMPGVEPTFKINKLSLPNTQFVEFHWNNNKKEGYPISFSVSNSNKYFKVSNIDSYAIPELIKPVVKPTFWQKISKGAKESSKYLIGAGIGAGAVLLLK